MCALGNIDTSSITLSGVSSGAAIALQMEVAYSSIFSGAAIIAGIPYYCARDNFIIAETCATLPSAISATDLEADMKQFAQDGKIDSLSNLSQHSLYLFSGYLDTVVSQGSVRLVEQIARDLGTTKVLSEYSLLAEHCVPTDDWGNLCEVLSTPFINNCDYDAAGRALQFFYGTLNSPVTPTGKVITIEQKKYTPNQVDPGSLSMDTIAYIYVPSKCGLGSSTQCRLHVSFHGCLQGEELVGRIYVDHGGFNKWAESNNIIVLYPQAISTIFGPVNPEGCWDWWGYTTSDYAFKNAPQMVTIRNMINYIVTSY